MTTSKSTVTSGEDEGPGEEDPTEKKDGRVRQERKKKRKER